jgi:hypothetical protein
MADDFALNSLLSTFLDDPLEIPSELDVSAISQKEVETQVNRTLSYTRGLFSNSYADVVDAIAESSDAIAREEVFDALKGLLKYP